MAPANSLLRSNVVGQDRKLWLQWLSSRVLLTTVAGIRGLPARHPATLPTVQSRLEWLRNIRCRNHTKTLHQAPTSSRCGGSAVAEGGLWNTILLTKIPKEVPRSPKARLISRTLFVPRCSGLCSRHVFFGEWNAYPVEYFAYWVLKCCAKTTQKPSHFKLHLTAVSQAFAGVCLVRVTHRSNREGGPPLGLVEYVASTSAPPWLAFRYQ